MVVTPILRLPGHFLGIINAGDAQVGFVDAQINRAIIMNVQYHHCVPGVVLLEHFCPDKAAMVVDEDELLLFAVSEIPVKPDYEQACHQEYQNKKCGHKNFCYGHLTPPYAPCEAQLDEVVKHPHLGLSTALNEQFIIAHFCLFVKGLI